jgi:hypothetical protein
MSNESDKWAAGFVEVFRAESAIAAHLLKARLESAGVPTKITDESWASLAGLNPLWWESPRILVARRDIAKAGAVIRKFEAVRSGRAN